MSYCSWFQRENAILGATINMIEYGVYVVSIIQIMKKKCVFGKIQKRFNEIKLRKIIIWKSLKVQSIKCQRFENSIYDFLKIAYT